VTEINTDIEKTIDTLFIKLNSSTKLIANSLQNFKITDEDIINSNCITYTKYGKTYNINVNSLKKPELLRDNY